ncbi:MAG: DUF4105 domain-containing protein [Arenimonas sp.]|nr:DUF4105 domain-containing protein [Arenimonas sp.]
MAIEVRRLFAVLALLCFSLLSLPATAQLRVGVMTMQPGGIFWERFGHNAIVIDDGKQVLSYNFGFFDLSEPGFTRNFIAGRMNYILAALPLEQDLAYYRQAGRGVSIQWLNLSEGQKARINRRLQYLAKPENARYRYDYYTNNCATQVRDVLDETLDGRLYRLLSASSQGNTYRSESVRLAWPAKWMALGFDLGMSGNGDKPLSKWQEAFIPMLLERSLGGVSLQDGQPLVAGTQSILPHRLPQPPDELPQWSLTAMAIGLALAGLFAWAGRKPALQSALMLGFWLLSGLLGSVMLALWAGTGHVYTHGNENLLLFSPLAWLAFALHFSRNRSTRWCKAYQLTVVALAAMAVLAALLKFMPFSAQQNLNWILMALPLHWLIARRMRLPAGQK